MRKPHGVPNDRARGTARRTRAGDREDRKAEAAEILRSARLASNVTEEGLADDAGVSRALIRGMESIDDHEHPPHLDVAMSPAIAVEAVKLLAKRAGLVVVCKLPELAPGAHEHLRMAVDVQRECADVLNAFLPAIADGHVSPSENAHVRAQAWEAIEALARLIGTLEGAQLIERSPRTVAAS